MGVSDKLLKFLNLTTSDSDGEALNAIRMANKYLKANGLSWDQVVNCEGVEKPKDNRKSFDTMSKDELKKFVRQKLASSNKKESLIARMIIIGCCDDAGDDAYMLRKMMKKYWDVK